MLTVALVIDPPIPLDVLDDSFQLFSYQGRIDGKKAWKDPYIVENTRFEEFTTTQIFNNTEIIKHDTIIFVDIVNSKYNDIKDFTEKSKIVYNGIEKIITNVRPERGTNSLHHLEITIS